MKTCKYGHPRGTDLDCKACQISNRVKARWRQPSLQMVAASQANRLKSNTSGLNGETAIRKRTEYFSSQVHKDRARQQALKLAQERQQGIRPPAVRTTADTSLELAVQFALDQLKVKYEPQYSAGPYFFDVFLPDHATLLEVDGEWAHSQPSSIANDLAKDSYIKNQHSNLTLLRLPEILVRHPNNLLERLREITGPAPAPILDQTTIKVQVGTPDSASVFLASHGHLPRFRRNTRIVHAVYHGLELVGIILYTGTSGHHLGTSPRWCLELNRALFASGYESLLKAAVVLSTSLLPTECKVVASKLPFVGWTSEYGHWCLKLGDPPARPRTKSALVEAKCGKCGGICSVGKEAFRRAMKKHGVYYHHGCRVKMKWTEGCYANKVKRSNIDLKERSLVTCGCGKIASIQKGRLLTVVRERGTYRCISCGVRAAHEAKLSGRK